MRNTYYESTLSVSSSACDKSDMVIGSHFNWESIKKFIYLAHAFSSTTTTFDIFSKVLVVHVHLFEYVFYAVFIGVSYLFMDFFIKQYVRKLDTNELLNPLMRGVSVGILLQTALWSLLHASDLADSIRYFVVSINNTPAWSKCQIMTKHVACMTPQDVMLHCRDNEEVDFNRTSAHINYTKSFSSFDRNSMSMRLFVIGTVWICNFFIVTVTDKGLLKLFKFAFLWGIISTIIIFIFLIFSTKLTSEAFYDLMDVQNLFHINNFNLVTDPFGVGLIGIYDFGTMSPVTMVDNAVLIFAVIFICIAFIRSLIVRVLYLAMVHCVDVKMAQTPHYLLFAILPLSTEFMEAHKIFVLYIYSYLSAALLACLAMFTTTISQLLHSKYRSVKDIYIVGLLCVLGFILSLPLIAVSFNTRMGMLHGLNTCTLCLGALKVAIVMWIYGVQKFSTDIHFWLGFKPTQFWKYVWTMLPINILILGCSKIIEVMYLNNNQKTAAISWIVITLITFLISQAKVIIRYIFQNNIGGILRVNIKYGPPDADDLKRRKHFDEIVHSRQCKHKCFVLDEIYECNHLPLAFRHRNNLASLEESLTNLYEDSTKKKMSSVIDVSMLGMNLR